MAGKPNETSGSAANGTPKREDQTKCPRCGEFGCPATGGSKLRTEGRYRYRTCSTCGHLFETLQRHGTHVEEFVA